MKPLSTPDSHHLRAAQGWLELGNHKEANAELERIAPELRSHPDVLDLLWHIDAQSNKWTACVDIADALVKLDPNQPDAWIHRSYALHRVKRTQEAFDLLLLVANKFPKIWTIPYNLACYSAQLGRLDESQVWLKTAMTIDEDFVKLAAIDDPDLKPLWDTTDGALWKPTE